MTALHESVGARLVTSVGRGHPEETAAALVRRLAEEKPTSLELHRLAGIRRETAQARQAIEDPPLRRARHRLPWLIAGLAEPAAFVANIPIPR